MCGTRTREGIGVNRATRDKIVSGTGPDLTTGNSCWETPPAIFSKLTDDFGPFDVDLTADRDRHLCAQWFGPGSPYEPHALTAPWHRYGRRGYSNPPYGEFWGRMLAKARLELLHGFATTLLLPLRVTEAFREHVLRAQCELLYCDQRICFFENGHPRWNVKALAAGRHVPDPAIFDSIIVRYAPDIRSLRTGEWRVPVHVPPRTSMVLT